MRSLSERHRRYCRLVADGENLASAYSAAGFQTRTLKLASSAAAALMKKTAIQVELLRLEWEQGVTREAFLAARKMLASLQREFGINAMDSLLRERLAREFGISPASGAAWERLLRETGFEDGAYGIARARAGAPMALPEPKPRPAPKRKVGRPLLFGAPMTANERLHRHREKKREAVRRPRWRKSVCWPSASIGNTSAARNAARPWPKRLQ